MFRQANYNQYTYPDFMRIYKSYHDGLESDWDQGAELIDRACRTGDVNSQEAAQLQELKWNICLKQLHREYEHAVVAGEDASSVSFNKRILHLRSTYTVQLRIERMNCVLLDDERLTLDYGQRCNHARSLAEDFVQGSRECKRAVAKIKNIIKTDGYTEGAYMQLAVDLAKVSSLMWGTF